MPQNEDFEDGDCELKDGYDEYQAQLELEREQENQLKSTNNLASGKDNLTL